jgi:hypothetical protein
MIFWRKATRTPLEQQEVDFFSERLDFHAEQLKMVIRTQERELESYKRHIELIENRLGALDNWVSTIAATGALGSHAAPPGEVDYDEQFLKDVENLEFDPDSELTVGAITVPWPDDLGAEEEEEGGSEEEGGDGPEPAD